MAIRKKNASAKLEATTEVIKTAEAVAEKIAEAEAKPAERKFPIERLRPHARELFGVSSSTFAGAVASIPDGEYSISEIEKVIDSWKKKEVR